MKRQLDENERLVFVKMARLNGAGGGMNPEFKAYTIVDIAAAPETAETLQDNERLERIGAIIRCDPKGNDVFQKLLYRKIPASEIDPKYDITANEEKISNDLAAIFKIKERAKKESMNLEDSK